MKDDVVILVEFSETGDPIISVKGCPGPSCADLTRSLEAALGDVISDEKTPEFYVETGQLERVKARQ